MSRHTLDWLKITSRHTLDWLKITSRHTLYTDWSHEPSHSRLTENQEPSRTVHGLKTTSRHTPYTDWKSWAVTLWQKIINRHTHWLKSRAVIHCTRTENVSCTSQSDANWLKIRSRHTLDWLKITSRTSHTVHGLKMWAARHTPMRTDWTFHAGAVGCSFLTSRSIELLFKA